MESPAPLPRILPQSAEIASRLMSGHSTPATKLARQETHSVLLVYHDAEAYSAPMLRHARELEPCRSPR